MAATAISNIIDPEVLADQITAKYPDMLVLGNTNLVQLDGEFPLGTPGTKQKIPFWKRIAAFSAMSEGTPLVTSHVEAAAEYMIVQRAGAAYEVYDTAQLVSIADPMAEISSQISRRAAEYLDDKLVEKLEKTPNTYNGVDVGAGTMTLDFLINAMISTLGDNHQKLIASGALIMHSKVYGDLVKLGVIQNNYQSNMDFVKTGVVGFVLGLPIHLSDRATVNVVSTVPQYQSYIVGPSALGLFFQRQVNVEFDRDVLAKSDIVSADVHFAPHLFGWDDDADALAWEDAKSIHAINIKTK